MRSYMIMTAMVLSASILSACGTGQFVENNLKAYRGQPVSVAIAVFGNPTDQQVIEGNKVYFWSNIRFTDGRSCKIRASLDKQDIVTNWGYVNCAF